MKGIVFTEFLDMTEARFSADIADRMITEAALPSGGAYTSVGTYDIKEMVALLSALSSLTGTPVSQLLEEFGRHLFPRFVATFPDFFIGVTSSFQFLASVDSVVHLEVRKLYPDAELPTFKCREVSGGRMLMEYRSDRNLPDLAEGLIRGCAQHFGEDLSIARSVSPDDPGAIVFEIRRSGQPL